MIDKSRLYRQTHKEGPLNRGVRLTETKSQMPSGNTLSLCRGQTRGLLPDIPAKGIKENSAIVRQKYPVYTAVNVFENLPGNGRDGSIEKPLFIMVF